MKIKWLPPLLSRLRRKNEEDGRGHGPHLINEKTSTRVLEAYSMMRTNLLYTGADAQGGAVFGFTSAAPGDGKSLTCANIAISFAMSGKRVVLLDCDMRKPSQNAAFGLGSEKGLSEYLAGVCDKPEILQTECENLSLLVAGRCPPNPAELLYRPRFAELIAELKTQYDCIFVDLPPIGMISDTTIVAPYMNAYVIVTRAGRSDSRLVQASVEAIEKVGGKIAGFVLNAVEDSYCSSRRHGRYDRYYGKYYGGYYYGHKACGDASETAEALAAPEIADASTQEETT